MNVPTPLTHRLWLIAWCGRAGKPVTEEVVNIFQNKMAQLLARYEREETLDDGTLEAIRLREWARLMKEVTP